MPKPVVNLDAVHPAIIDLIEDLLEQGFTPHDAAKITRQSEATVLAVANDRRLKKRPTGPDPDDPVDQMAKACNEMGVLVLAALKSQAEAASELARVNPEGSIALLNNVLDTSDRLFVRRGEPAESRAAELPRVVPTDDPA